MLKGIGKAIRSIHLVWRIRRVGNALGNWRRRRFTRLDYVMVNVPETLPALPESRNFIRRRLQGPPPFSLWDMERVLRRIGDDPRPKGVILRLRGLRLSLADLQTLRGFVLDLRQRGKRVVCYAQNYDMAAYYLASVCDEVLLQTGGTMLTMGLRQQAVFFGDALAAVGVKLDVVAISPYKGAFDQFSRNDMSPEGRQQLDWLMDSRYRMLVEGIAEGRKTTPEAVQAMIDRAPYMDDAAKADGYVDATLSEEELPVHLGVKHLVPWEQASKILAVKLRPPAEKYVALLRVGGLMVMGESGSPPVDIPIPIPFVGSERAGDQTVVRQIRHLMKNKNAAAVILFIDSGGGDSTAAEAMTSALAELAKDRPLVVYMNSVAASGGYYIATPGRWIVAQPGTITGSIGVLTAKPITRGALERLRVNTVELTRGANAALFSDSAPFTDAQRAQMRQWIEHVYQQFIKRVADSRKISLEAVDAVGGGRVWTGVQAKEHGLVDELGDLKTALKKARELANLPDAAPLVVVSAPSKPLPPQLAEAGQPAAYLRYGLQNAEALWSGSAQMLMPFEWW